jgi:hypothetical protein
MPVVSNIRRYANLRAVSLHLVEINKKYKSLAKDLSKVEAAGKVMRVGPSAKPKVDVSQELPDDAIARIHKNSKIINDLNSQYSALSNMILNLNTQFKTSDVDPDLITSLTQNITSLQTQIRKSLQSTNRAASATAQNYASDESLDYVKKVTKFLDSRFNAKGVVTASSGLHADSPTLTHFVTYEHIKNDKGEVEPSITIAISETKGHHWINPNIVKARTVGNFRLGFQLPDEPKAAMKEIEHYIQEQMTADSHLSVLAPKLVPFAPEQLHLDKGVATNVDFEEHSITVELNSNIKTEAQAEEAAQQLYRTIHTAMVSVKSRTRDRIVYVVSKGPKGWQVVYKFATGDKFTGRTLSNEETKRLSNIFDEEEVKVIKKALNSMPGKE